MKELYRKYRPKNFDEVLGQATVIKTLKQMQKKKNLPHVTLLSGPSGCSKTTLARIIASILGAADHQITETNSGDFKGIETIRDIRNRMGRSAFGKCRVWILNEVHQYRKDAQDAMLQILEDTPDWVYFILTTTDPHRLQTAVRNRCTEFKVKKLDSNNMEKLIDRVLKAEKKKISEDVKDKLVEVADGTPRQALVILNQVIQLKKEKDQLDTIENQNTQQQVFDLLKVLTQHWTRLPDIIKILNKIDDDPEKVRRIILESVSTMILGQNKQGKTSKYKGGNNDRLFQILDCFSPNYYDVGRAGLLISCRQLVSTKKSGR